MERIGKWKRIIVGYEPRIFIAGLIILAVFGGFIAGRASALEGKKIEVKSLSATSLNATINNNTSQDIEIIEDVSIKAGGAVVASKSGSKYHLPWCSGASTIKEENKIWFDSVEEARKAGYTPAGNCKGIE
ncbi:MAG: hypothetical protein AAB840_01690 [Patescibacteria group bacterium]